MIFTKEDRLQIEQFGISEITLTEQIQTFTSGIPFVNLLRAATINDGILKLNKEEENALVEHFDGKKEELDLLKFTPASGAATRMFKFLFEFFTDYNEFQGTINAYVNKNKVPELRLFFVGLDSFPFFRKGLKKMIELFGNEEDTDINSNRLRYVKAMLSKEGLNYTNLPKGLIPFHKYKGHIASAFEEHLFEGALYAASKGKSKLHFTISPEHQHLFDAEVEAILPIVEEKTNTSFEISFSYQSRATDTIAVDLKNKPFRKEDNSLLLRPGGHGALLNNLNEQQAEVIFIKNIDNVVVYQHEVDVAKSKKILAGKLLQLQEKTFHFLELLDTKSCTASQMNEVVHFLITDLNVVLSTDFKRFSKDYQLEYLHELLNRPIRVCGMVVNEGEPGGGPFWVKEESGRQSLQIIESVQIDPNSKPQQTIVQEATHFNPVDIVCGVRDYKGEKFNLLDFRDPKAGFITKKTIQGKTIKALEHPGLWNGGMAYWNTVFIEVPLITFNPVKTVNDLLKPAHQITK